MNCNVYGNIIISNDSFVNIEPASLKTFGGYIDGDNFVPVRFGLKYPKKGKTVLYVVVSQEKIKTDGFKDRRSKNSTNSTSASVALV